jgi:hypothetical protein
MTIRYASKPSIGMASYPVITDNKEVDISQVADREEQVITSFNSMLQLSLTGDVFPAITEVITVLSR